MTNLTNLKESLEVAAKAMNWDVEFDDGNEDAINFRFDGIDFVVSQELGEVERLWIGGKKKIEANLFQAFVTKHIPQTYWEPPDSEEIALGEPTESVNAILKQIVSCAVNARIDNALEHVYYQKLYEQEKNLMVDFISTP
jgi:hypothetical protein